MTLPADAPPVRPCFGCRVFDDHPRHVVDNGNGTEFALHMDCCAERGCQVCKIQLQRAEHRPGVVGDELRSRLEQLPPLQIVHQDGNPHGEVIVRG